MVFSMRKKQTANTAKTCIDSKANPSFIRKLFRSKRSSSTTCCTTAADDSDSSDQTCRSSVRRVPLQGSFQGRSDTLEVHIPNQPEPVLRKRSVLFNENVLVYEVPRAASLAEDRTKLWFQREEYFAIQQKINAVLVASANRAESMAKRNYCTRGLERVASPLEANAIVHNAVQLVLNEQRLQRCKNNYNPEYLATVYKFRTSNSASEALVRAIRDAIEASEYQGRNI